VIALFERFHLLLVDLLAIHHDLVITLNNREPVLSGNITNASKYTLRDVVLITPSGWIKIDDLSKNKTEKVDYVLTNTASNSSVDMYAISSVLGTDDIDQRRRSAFLQANMTSSSGYVNMNSGIYLMGWVDAIPAPASLQGETLDSIDTMLYFEMLTPVVAKNGPARAQILSGDKMITEMDVELSVAPRWTVYLVQHVHTDIGYTRPQTEILPEHLPRSVRAPRATPHPAVGSHGQLDLPTLVEMERAHMKRTLEATAGHRGQAARILGISERNLYRKLREHGLLT
jgi:hypothetical protein